VRQLRLHLVVAPLAIADALDGRDLPAMARVQRHQTLQSKINYTEKFLEDLIHELNKICSRRNCLAFLPHNLDFFRVTLKKLINALQLINDKGPGLFYCLF